MKNLFYRFMPIVFGFFLGWMIFNPPVWLESLGMARWLVNLVMVGLLLVSVVPLIALANLPENLKMKIVSESAVQGELQQIRNELHALGFRDAGPPLQVEVAPPAIVLGFVHEKEPVYATAFRTTTVPPKVSYDMVSMLDGDRGGLTTNSHPEGAVLPAAPGAFRQVLPGVSKQELLEAHLEGLAYLREQGVGVRPVSGKSFPRDLQLGLGKQRETFLSAPLRASWLTLWRAATKQVPFRGRLRDQAIAAQQIQSLQTGQTQRAF